MICDEIWNYDDTAGTATLSGVRILCRECSDAKHVGYAQTAGRGREAIDRLVEVNGIDRRAARKLVTDAASVWRHRSERRWRIVVSKELLDPFPFLAALDGLKGAPGDGSRRVREKEGG